MTPDELMDLRDDIAEVDEWNRPLSIEYLYGAADIVWWLAQGKPKADSRMAATNSRLAELLTQMGHGDLTEPPADYRP